MRGSDYEFMLLLLGNSPTEDTGNAVLRSIIASNITKIFGIRFILKK